MLRGAVVAAGPCLYQVLLHSSQEHKESCGREQAQERADGHC